MNGNQFDGFARALSSRRIALTSLLGSGIALLGLTEPDAALGHNLEPGCKKIKNAEKRRACLRRARKHNKTHRCETKAKTCAGRCGLAANNCGKAVKCPHCPNAKACLNNGSCATVCASQADCPGGNYCASGNVEGAQYCGVTVGSCDAVPVTCVSTTDCPLGFQCLFEPACGALRCFPLNLG